MSNFLGTTGGNVHLHFAKKPYYLSTNLWFREGLNNCSWSIPTNGYILAIGCKLHRLHYLSRVKWVLWVCSDLTNLKTQKNNSEDAWMQYRQNPAGNSIPFEKQQKCQLAVRAVAVYAKFMQINCRKKIEEFLWWGKPWHVQNII